MKQYPEPYSYLTDILTMEEIEILANKLKGVQVYFRAYEIEKIRVYTYMVNCIGEDKTKLVCERFASDTIYFPNLNTIDNDDIHREIKESYNGRNITDLAIKYKFSEKAIRNIIGTTQSKKQIHIDGQIKMW